ncbi:MAG: tryptophan synthase subunit beta, partial [Candidatus Rokuibacteriota bacterium]
MTQSPGRPGRPRARQGGGRALAGGPPAAGVGAGLPDRGGHFGRYGGRFVPETLMSPLIELERAWAAARRDRSFQARLA